MTAVSFEISDVLNVHMYPLWTTDAASLKDSTPAWILTARANKSEHAPLVLHQFVKPAALPRLRAEAIAISSLAEHSAASLLDHSLLQPLFQNVHFRASLHAILNASASLDLKFSEIPPLRVMISETGHQVIARTNNVCTACLVLEQHETSADNSSGDAKFAQDDWQPGSLVIRNDSLKFE